MGRKGKPLAASSAKALEVCGGISNLGTSAADVFAQFAAPEAAYGRNAGCQDGSLDDAEISMALQLLQKKDPTSRLRGVGELAELLGDRPVEILREVCGKFVNLYCLMWPQEAEPRVREGLHRSLRILVSSLQKDFGKHIRLTFPVWLCAMFDGHVEVTQSARKTFQENFSTDERRRGVFRHCQLECIQLYASNLRHSEQSLHDALGAASTAAPGDKNVALERQDRYIRVVSASLLGLGELVPICSAEPAEGPKGKNSGYKPLCAEDLEQFLVAGSASSIWVRLGSKQPELIRRAAAQCLARLFQSPCRSSDWAKVDNRSKAIGTLSDDAIPASVAASLVRSFFEIGGEPSWQGLDAAKSLSPWVISAIKRGCPRDQQFLDTLPVLLKSLPVSFWVPGRCEAMLSALLEGAKSALGDQRRGVWKTFFNVLRAAKDAGSPASDEWTWLPLELYFDPDSKPVSGQVLETPLPVSVLEDVPAFLRDEQALQQILSDHPSSTCVARLITLLGSNGETQAADAKQFSAWSRRASTLAMAASLPTPQSEDGAAQFQEVRDRARNILSSVVKPILVDLASPDASVATAAAERWSALFEKKTGGVAILNVLPNDWVPLDDPSLRSAMETLFARLPASAHGQIAGSCSQLAASWDASALVWPLLPLWRARLWCDDSDGNLEAARALSNLVISPLLQSMVGRACVRDDETKREILTSMVCEALFPEQAVSDETHTDVSARRLAAALRLAFEVVPSEFAMRTTRATSRAVIRLAEVLAKGNLQENDAEEAENSIKLVLKPAYLTAEVANSCIKVITERVERRGAEQPQDALRLGLLCASALEAYVHSNSSSATCPSQLCCAVAAIVARALVNFAVDGDGVRTMVKQSCKALQTLLSDVPYEEIVSHVLPALGPPPEQRGKLRPWVRCFVAVSKNVACKPAQLLLDTRIATGENRHVGLSGAGELRVPDLCRLAAATAEIYCIQEQEDTAGLAIPDSEEDGALFWEMLVGGAASGSTVALLASEKVLHDLLEKPVPIRWNLLRSLASAVAEEGTGWWLQGSGPEEHSKFFPMSFRLHGLAMFRKVLQAVWRDSQDVDFSVLEALLATARKEHCVVPAWGYVVEAIAERCADFKGTVSERLRSLAVSEQERWRETIRRAASTSGNPDRVSLIPSSLLAAAAVESWAEAAKDPKTTSPHEAKNIDAGVLETHETLLRWAQSNALNGRWAETEAFATYVASTWPSLVASSAQPLSKSSQSVVRMHRFTLELLGGLGPKQQENCPNTPLQPGAFRLVAAVCKSGLWPDASWTHVLSAVTRAAELSSTLPQPVAQAFVDDASRHAATVIPYVPAARANALASFFGVSSEELRMSAVTRLRSQLLVPRSMAPAEGDKNIVDALREFKSAFADDDADTGEPAQALPRGCENIVFSTFSTVFGKDLVEHLWSAKTALDQFILWEAGFSGEDGDSDTDGDLVAQNDSIMRHSRSRRASSASSISDLQEATASGQPSHLSAQLGRRCIAAFSAWEVTLRDITTATCPTSSSSSQVPGGPDDAAASPAGLLANALQLPLDLDRPTQSSRLAEAQRSAANPKSDAVPPAWHLFKLACHVLTSPRLLEIMAESSEDVWAREITYNILACTRDEVAIFGGTSDARGTSITQGLPQLSGPSFLSARRLAQCLVAGAVRALMFAFVSMPASLRSFWEGLPRRRDRDLVEKLVAKHFMPHVFQAETNSVQRLLELQRDSLSGVEAAVAKRPRQLVMQLEREDLNVEFSVHFPDAFPLRIATVERDEKVPGVPVPRVRKWMLQVHRVLAGTKPAGVSLAMTMWARNFSLFFEGVEDCPICYNVLHISSQSIPRKSCATCKHKFHSECLHHWFRTSQKTTCPLCNQSVS